MSIYQCKNCSHEMIAEFCPDECEICGSKNFVTETPTPQPTPQSRKGIWFVAIFSIALLSIGIWQNNWFGLKNTLLDVVEKSDRINLEDFDLANTAKREIPNQAKQTQKPPLLPKDVLKTYYRLAPRDRNQAMKFLSPAWERVKLRDNEVSFWFYVKDTEIYAFKSLNKNKERVEIRVWLKYNMKNSHHPRCEARTFEAVLYELNGEKQWLLEDTYNPTQKPRCEI